MSHEGIKKVEKPIISEAARSTALEAYHTMSEKYEEAKREVARLEATPESYERDDALIIQYGKMRLFGERLKAMGVVNPDTIQ